MTNKILEAALKYIDMGFSVVPLARGTRIPPKGFELSKYFNERASKDTFTGWTKKYTGCNLAIITGQISKICAVDLDKDKPEYDESIELEYFSDSLVTPASKTPSGGRHLYFRSPNGIPLSSKTGVLPAIDFKCDNSYIVAPPSVLIDGTKYEWLDGLSIGDVLPADIPLSFLNQINKNNNINNSFSLYGGVTAGGEHLVTSVTKGYIWNEGTRDSNLYYVAQCMKDCGSEYGYIAQVLRAIVLSWGEVNEKWVDEKIQSAVNHLARKERNWQEDVDRYIVVTDGTFSVTDCYHTLQAVTKLDKGAIRVALNRRKGNTIQKVGGKDGVYTKIQQEMEFLDFDDKEEIPYPIKLPMRLNDLVDIYEGNIILVAGEYNAGKTSFCLNVLQENRNKLPIRYLSSEMDSGEFKGRFKGFNLPLSFWKPDEMLEYVRLKSTNDYHHCLKADALNIIDYLEFREADYFLGATIMQQIHDVIGRGACVIGIQKKEGVRLPRSGDMVLEKPRLAITLSKCNDEKDMIITEILKAKNVRMGKCDGKKAKYEILDKGARFKELISWCRGKIE